MLARSRRCALGRARPSPRSVRCSGRRAELHPAGLRMRHAEHACEATATESRPARARAGRSRRGSCRQRTTRPPPKSARADQLPSRDRCPYRWLVRHLRQPHHAATAARRVAWMGFTFRESHLRALCAPFSGQNRPLGPENRGLERIPPSAAGEVPLGRRDVSVAGLP